MIGAAAVAQKCENGGAVFENQCKQTPKKSIPERREWMLSSCYRWYLRTDLFSYVLYTQFCIDKRHLHSSKSPKRLTSFIAQRSLNSARVQNVFGY